MNLPWCGYYHPAAEKIFQDFDGYQAWYGSHSDACTGKGVERVGIYIPRSLLVKQDTVLIDLIIRKLEESGIFPVPVFGQKKEYGGPDCPDPETVLALLQGVDGIINCESAFLLPADKKQADQSILEVLNVPILQAVHSSGATEAEWRQNPRGLTASNQIYWIAQPEINGVIEPVVVSARDETSDEIYGLRQPIEERVAFLVNRMTAWLHLGRLPASRRKVAFLLHTNPCAGLEGSVGGGAGLDTLESVAFIMGAMEKEGYTISGRPRNGKDLIDAILRRKALSEFRWTTAADSVKNGGVLDLVDMETYLGWFQKLPLPVQEKMTRSWGPPPGEGMIYDQKLIVTGLEFGNVFVLVEPKRGCYGARCDGQVCKILHDPSVPPTHQCLATYNWLQERMDVIISVGTHGYLEFLPGKGVGLSNECFPEIMVGKTPHIYIYTVKNNSEGIIAKRRSYATLIDHLVPAMKPSGLYDELEEMAELLRQYTHARNLQEENRKNILFGKIHSLAVGLHFIAEDENIPEETLIAKLHAKLDLFQETQIKDGLHVFGRTPDDQQIACMVASSLRFEGQNPSLRRLLAELMGFDYEKLMVKKELQGEPSEHAVLAKINECAVELVYRSLNDRAGLQKHVEALFEVRKPELLPKLAALIDWALDTIVLRLKMTAREIPQLLRAMDKEYIEPGPAGFLSRGKTDILPTGRNFYSIDTRAVPTKAAWEVGVRMADSLLHAYLHEEEKYPENLGMVLWAVDTYRAEGEQIAQILYLMGARPLWNESGIVRGTEAIPLKELRRPRIDVTIRTSGIFRDNLPHLIDLIDDTVRMIAALNEREDYNYVRKHVQSFLAKEDSQQEAAFQNRDSREREATYRIFSSQPGAYGGGGVSYMIAASAWETFRDLGEQYIERGGYAYGRGTWGEVSHHELVDRLQTVEATYHKLASDESDVLDCCCFYDFHGGMHAAVKTVSEKDPKTYWGDTRDPHHPETRLLKDEMERIARAKLLNPQWIEGMKRHGYKGAGDIAKRVGRMYGWDASAEVVADWIFDGVAETFVLNEENRKFFEINNPWALEEMTRRLLEAEKREVWKADPEVLKALREQYLEIEGWLEEKIEEAGGDFQGGSVDILTKRYVEAWAAAGKFNLKR